MAYTRVVFPVGQLEDMAVAAARSALRELTLEFPRDATDITVILTSLRDHTLIQRLCLREYAVDLTGLETVLLSDSSRITELAGWRSTQYKLDKCFASFGTPSPLTKLKQCCFSFGLDEARLLRMAL
jgi:hypothetical protein